MTFIPSYIELFESGELSRRIEKAGHILKSCTSCPRECHVDRTSSQYGFCQSSSLPIVSSYTLHHGEEPVISGSKGAGNIFFGNCSLRCIFCQNHQISQNWEPEKENEIPIERLADIMIELQNEGAHNIGLVSPTHYSVQILNAINIAIGKGLHLPIIYNTNGYDSVEMLQLFEGVIDIFLPDIKYGNNLNAEKFSEAVEYFDHTRKAVTEMFRQVGDELICNDETAVRGLIIRHLVLPNGLADSEQVFKFISEKLSHKIHISLMAQYYPTHHAHTEPSLNRTINESEYNIALELLDKYGLENGWIQELNSSNHYQPDFLKDRNQPFKSQSQTS